ncbi:MAG: hypothetical protein FGM16_09970 [Flavobacterium sp.]|nr:hypothetical protein [Flavobacterium sp.]
MKNLFFYLVVVGFIFTSCTGPQGMTGDTGYSAEAEVFELRNINFDYNAVDGYTIYRSFNPQIYASDNVLIYRMTSTINSQTPIWQLIPRTLFLGNGQELDYDFDFSKQDFTIYAGGNFNLATMPVYLTNQTFRIVIIPGYFSNKSAQKEIDFSDYQAVVRAYHIDKSDVKLLNN